MAKANKVKIPTKKLNSGYDIPVLGYGTWIGCNDQGELYKEDIPKMLETLKYAIEAGYRHVDTAHLYRVEGVVGDAISEKIADGTVKREDLFITTKLWNHMHAPEDVEKSLRASLGRLKTDYVDLFLIHWPVSYTTEGQEAGVDILDTWRGMEAVQAAGLARSIGVSNFNVDQLKRVLANCNVKPAMNQIELNLNLLQRELVDFCTTSGVAVTAYTPFGSMLPGRDPAGSPQPKVNHPVLLELAKKYSKTPTQLVLRFLCQRGVIAIPKTITKHRAIQNAQIFDFELWPEDARALGQFDCGYRTIRQEQWQDHPDYPFDKLDIVVPPTPTFLLKWDD